MADFKKIYEDISLAAKKVAKKANEAADVASLYAKKKSLEVRLSEEYENLGRLAYKQLRLDASNTEEISAKLDKIDEIKAGIAEFDLKIKERKAKKQENAEDNTASDAPAPEAEEEPSEEADAE